MSLKILEKISKMILMIRN